MQNFLPLPVSSAWQHAAFSFVDPHKPIEIASYLSGRCGYRLGAKASPLSINLDAIHALDCSGFHRLCLFHALGSPSDFDFPDGSVNQHAWYEAHGFKACEAWTDGSLDDGVWRAWVLEPQDSGEGVGHILFTFGGSTFESYGGHGVGSRRWGSQGFMGRMHGFVLTLPAWATIAQPEADGGGRDARAPRASQ